MRGEEEVMQVYHQTIDLVPQAYPLQLAVDPAQALYIDIETTGLSPERDRICLIGCACLQQDRWQLVQWFDDTGTSEQDLLLSFLIFMKKYKALVHYNGERFDLPFLVSRIEKCEPALQLGGEAILNQLHSIDLYKAIRPWKKRLGLENLRQKTLENFIGDGRTEDMDGRQLVEIYRASLQPGPAASHEGTAMHLEGACHEDAATHLQDASLENASVYLQDASHEDATAHLKDASSQHSASAEDRVRKLQQLVLDHNAADVRGLIAITPLYALSDLFRHKLNVRKAQANHYRSYDGEPREEIVLFARIEGVPEEIIPRRITMSADGCYASLLGSEITLKIPLFRGELKFFYANYQDYYYLPAEDAAIHKSLASFVDKSHRVQATAATCYTRKSGAFLPEWTRFRLPFFKKDYKDPYAWFEFQDDMKRDKQFFCDYAAQVLDHIIAAT